MASQIDGIMSQLATDLSTVTADTGAVTLTAKYAIPQTSTTRPIAWIRADPGAVDYATSVLDRSVNVVILVQGSRAHVSELLERIAYHYETPANFAAIHALGLLDFEVDGNQWEEPVEVAGSDCMGSVGFIMRYRISV